MFCQLSAVVVATVVVAAPITSADGSPVKLRDDTVRLYLIPFGVETYLPVRKDDIEAKALCVVELRGDEADAARLSELLFESRRGKLDELRVRVKVDGIGGDAVYIDADGGVSQGERQWRLKRGAFKELRVLVDRVASNRCPDW